jgi:hypothetical protein
MRRRPRLVPSRLAPRRRVGAATRVTGAWKAIVVTWRKTDRTSAHPRRREIGRATNSWTHYFALQFTFPESRTPRLALPPLPPQVVRELVRSDARTEMRLKHALLRQTSSLVVRGGADREHSETLFRNRVIRETNFSELQRTFRFDNLKLARIFTRDAAELPRRPISVHGVRSAAHRSTTRLPSFFRTSRQPFVRPLELSVMATQPRPHRAVVVEQRARTAAEIVWPLRTSSFSDGHVDLTVPAVALARAGTESTATAAAQAFAMPPANSAAAFDSALIDRVAEDVIGRVERRIRIERERRGL